MDLAIKARRVVLPDGERPRTVGVHAGRIVAIEPFDVDIAATELVELAADEVLLPGLVDSHVHVNDPGRSEWEGFGTATRAAAAGGITTIVDMPLNSLPPTVNVPALREKRAAAAGRVHVDVGFWGGAIPGNAGDMPALAEEGVFGFKCFLLHSGVDEFPPLNTAELQHALTVAAEIDAMVIVHAEDAEIIASAPEPHGQRYRDFLRSRPHDAEDVAIARVLDLAGKTGARVHILHLSSSDALPMIERARADGVRVTVETCPHYLSFSAEEIEPGATTFKCCPPIREAANQDRLWAGLRDGLIDCVVSDHSPCTPELKRLDSGDFGTAWGGIASVQLGLSAVWTQARRRGFGLNDVVRWMAEGPAAQVGLPDKGRIALGYAADFSVFAPEDSFVVDAAKLAHRNPVTAYHGRELAGMVRRTWLRGKPISGDAPHGELLAHGHGANEQHGNEHSGRSGN